MDFVNTQKGEIRKYYYLLKTFGILVGIHCVRIVLPPHFLLSFCFLSRITVTAIISFKRCRSLRLRPPLILWQHLILHQDKIAVSTIGIWIESDDSELVQVMSVTRRHVMWQKYIFLSQIEILIVNLLWTWTTSTSWEFPELYYPWLWTVNKLAVKAALMDIPFSSKPCESSMTLFPDVARILAISQAASSQCSLRKPLFWHMASPISLGLFASPCTWTMIDYRQVRVMKSFKWHTCFSWIAWSTKKVAQNAVCWATYSPLDNRVIYEQLERLTCFASTACVNSGEKATWVIDMSSRTRPNFRAQSVRLSRTSLETCKEWLSCKWYSMTLSWVQWCSDL